MILKITKTNNGTEWKVSNRQDQLNRWAGTVSLSQDESDISCDCDQSKKYLDCTHKVQVREYMELNNHQAKEVQQA
jgi:hypothetical protein